MRLVLLEGNVCGHHWKMEPAICNKFFGSYQNVYNISGMLLFWLTAGDGCASPVGVTWKWSGCLWGRGVITDPWPWRGEAGDLVGGGFVEVNLLCNWRSMQATDGRKCHVPQAADTILHSCPTGRRRAKIAGQAHKSSWWVCGMRSKHSHRSLSSSLTWQCHHGWLDRPLSASAQAGGSTADP